MKHSELKKIVLIGASTGGPGQIEKIIKALPTLHDTSVIIAQHITKGFAESFSKRLDRLSDNNVIIVKDFENLIQSNIYICCGRTSIYKKDNKFIFSREEPVENGYNPDINILFKSFVELTDQIEILSVILTGIGEDGVNGCNELSLMGARVITESESSAIVDGMPSRARSEITNIEINNIDNIVNNIREFCN